MHNWNCPGLFYPLWWCFFENLERASNRLQTVVPIALLLIFVLIYFALKSVPQTLMIYIAIPMATIGGVVALWLQDMPFSISAGVGFIVLFGVAVLNGLVMISGLNELKEEGVTNLKNEFWKAQSEEYAPLCSLLYRCIGLFTNGCFSIGRCRSTASVSNGSYWWVIDFYITHLICIAYFISLGRE